MQKINKKGFTLIELLVVIAIIGLLSTLAVVSLNNARQKSRDARRISDVKQIQTALELYYNDEDGYPDGATADQTVTPGTKLEGPTSDVTYMAIVPDNPSPQTDGTCPGSGTDGYTYTQTGTSGSSYTIRYCVGAKTGTVAKDLHTATPSGIANP